MHIAIRDFELTSGSERWMHCFCFGEVRYTYTVKPGRQSVNWTNAPGDFCPPEKPEVEVTEIAICLHGSRGWTPVDGMLWDFLREVDDAWLIEQIEPEDAE
jgi:hypothetical protein